MIVMIVTLSKRTAGTPHPTTGNTWIIIAALKTVGTLKKPKSLLSGLFQKQKSLKPKLLLNLLIASKIRRLWGDDSLVVVVGVLQVRWRRVWWW